MHKALGQALLSCAIPAPLRMPEGAAAPAQCAVDLAAGGLEVSSGAGGRRLAHLRASASRLLVPPPLTAAAAPQPQPGGLSILVSLVAVPAATAQPAGLPAATAGVALRPAEHASGYLAHPAAVDSMLHIGAALAAALQKGTAAETRVPTAVGAFAPRAELCGAQGAWACAAVTGQLSDGSATSSYRLSADAAPGSVVSLADLQAKALDTVQSAGASPGKEHIRPQLLYKLAWQSSSPQQALASASHHWGCANGWARPQACACRGAGMCRHMPPRHAWRTWRCCSRPWPSVRARGSAW